MPRAATPLAVAAAWTARAQAEGRVIVTTNGCYDLFHAGHLETLEGARARGDGLIVLINSDASVKRFKGAQRPYLSQEERAALLGALRVVDHVVIFEEDTPMEALHLIQARIHVKGGSYLPERVAAEEALVRSWGGELTCLPLRPGISSSELLKRIWRDRPVELDEGR